MQAQVDKPTRPTSSPSPPPTPQGKDDKQISDINSFVSGDNATS